MQADEKINEYVETLIADVLIFDGTDRNEELLRVIVLKSLENIFLLGKIAGFMEADKEMGRQNHATR